MCETKEEKGTALVHVGYNPCDDEIRYKCPFCDESYGSWDIRRRKNWQNIDYTFKCDKCGKLLLC